jgi:hypothetical protein
MFKIFNGLRVGRKKPMSLCLYVRMYVTLQKSNIFRQILDFKII